MDNYALQAQRARERFLSYDPEALARKHWLTRDGEWLRTELFRIPCRLSLHTGDLQRLREDRWEPWNGFGQTMTLLDLLCDSREDRFVTGRLKDMADFGLRFHSGLLQKDPWAVTFRDRQEDFSRACLALGAQREPLKDVSFRFWVFEELTLVLQLWLGDEEFPPKLRLLWDENAHMYLRYETMYFAKGLLLSLLQAQMP